MCYFSQAHHAGLQALTSLAFHVAAPVRTIRRRDGTPIGAAHACISDAVVFYHLRHINVHHNLSTRVPLQSDPNRMWLLWL